jgi:hypothetical protein
MANKSEHIKRAIVEAMEQSLGVVTTACRKVGIGRTTYYEYYNTDLKFKEEIDDLQNVALDFAESQLHKQIKDGNSTATIFFSKDQRQETRIHRTPRVRRIFGQAISN